ncbi:MAG: type VI secretion system-associated protein TagO [Sneathiellaceae bacterium]
MKRTFWALVVCFCVGAGTGPSFAQAVGVLGLVGCTKVGDDTARLKCFDDAMANLSQPEPKPASESWKAIVKTDPLSEETIVTIANRGASTGRRPVLLFLRCTAGKAEAFVSFDEFLGSGSRDHGHLVSYRIGDDVVHEDVDWSLSTDKEAVFFVGKIGWFIGALLKSDRFVIRTTPYNESPITATFDLAGLRTTLDRVADKCDWGLQ